MTLENDHVRLEPLQREHALALGDVGAEPSIWTWFYTAPTTPTLMHEWVDSLIALRDGGRHLPFAIVERGGDRVVGSTSLGNLALEHRRLEIGWTWVAPAWQRTAVNTAAKRLLLGHAFDDLGCERVEFKTDAANERSRAAILRLGAIEEGTLRHHMRRPDGTWRDSVYFSLLADEWPAVRERLDVRLGQRST